MKKGYPSIFLFISAFVALIITLHTRVLLFNISASMPIGVYLRSFEGLKPGSIVTAKIPNYKTVLKYVVSTHTRGPTIWIRPDGCFMMNQYVIGPILHPFTGFWQFPFPPTPWQGMVYLSGTSINSHDSRYFGPIDENMILATWTPLLIAPDVNFIGMSSFLAEF